MAEYVDRLKLLPKVKTEYIEAADLGYGYYDYLLQKDLMDIEPADVVERSKIDKAINKLIQYSESLVYKGRLDLVAIVENCIDILKINIGE